SAHKDGEANDIFLAVGLVRAQRDRYRPRLIVQNDVARRGALGGFGPACSKTRLDLIERGDARLLSLCRALHFRGVTSIGGGAVERAILPTGQHEARIAKIALPRPTSDGGKPLFGHR